MTPAMRKAAIRENASVEVITGTPTGYGVSSPRGPQSSGALGRPVGQTMSETKPREIAEILERLAPILTKQWSRPVKKAAAKAVSLQFWQDGMVKQLKLMPINRRRVGILRTFN
jgi:hypothetical protein